MIIEIAASTLWTSLAVLNGELAETKGDRGCKWFLLSLPLGPLASVLIMARPVVKSRDGNAAVQQALEADGARRLWNESFFSAPPLKRDSLDRRIHSVYR